MFLLIYKKSTKHVVATRTDLSTPAPKPASYWFFTYIKDNKISDQDAQDLTYVETEVLDLAFDANKYFWNETTQQVEEDPNFVPPLPPTPPPEPIQPTTP
jgi:hypothetical protein